MNIPIGQIIIPICVRTSYIISLCAMKYTGGVLDIPVDPDRLSAYSVLYKFDPGKALRLLPHPEPRCLGCQLEISGVGILTQSNVG